MDRVVRLYQLWSWLPHFRAVAETEHLPTASEAFGVSTSALSRALKQLEESVGRELFIRDRSAIRLNEHGEALLRAVRYAMRAIDETVVALEADLVPRTLRIAAPAPYHAVLVLPAIARAKAQEKDLRFKLSACAPEAIVSALCQGSIDLAIHEGAIEHSELKSTILDPIENVVFAAPRHPAAKARRLKLADLLEYPFVGPPSSPAGLSEDGWPPAVERILGLTVSAMQMGIDAAQSGDYLTMLPRRVGSGYGLVELEVEGLALESGTLVATRRKAIETGPRQIDGFCQILVDLCRES